MRIHQQLLFRMWFRTATSFCLLLGLFFPRMVHAGEIVFSVDASAPTNGDCMSIPCWRITDAVAQARIARANDSSPIRIQVSPGTYIGNYGGTGGDPHTEDLPIVLDIPNITLAGSTVLELDPAGLPTGNIISGETRLESDGLLHAAQMLIAVVPTTAAPSITGVTIRGMVLDAHAAENGAGAFANVLVMDRVSGVVVDSNVILNGQPGISVFLTSGVFQRNYAAGNVDFGMSAAAGSNAHPATVLITQNRFVANGISGLALAGSYFRVFFDYGNAKVLEIPHDEIPDTLNVTVSRNDLSSNAVQGVRVLPYLPKLNADQHSSTINLSLSNNRINGNGRFGVEVGSGFTWRSKSNPGPYSVAVTITSSGNTIAGNGKAPGLLAFRNANWVNSGNPTSCTFQPLVKSSINLLDPDGSMAGAQVDNRKYDPNYLAGTVCPGDVPPSGAPLDNSLTINGVTMP